MMLGNPGGAGIIPKRGNFSAIFNQNTMQRLAGSEGSNKYTKISFGLLMPSGLEIKIGKNLKE